MDVCVVCGKEVKGYEPVYCCDGDLCGCMALPIEPCLCSAECEAQVTGILTKQYQQQEQPNERD